MNKRIAYENYLKNLYDNFDFVYSISTQKQKNSIYLSTLSSLKKVEQIYKEILRSVNEGLSVFKYFEMEFGIELEPATRNCKMENLIYEDVYQKQDAVLSRSMKKIFIDSSDGFSYARKNNDFLKNCLKKLESLKRKRIIGRRSIRRAQTVKYFLITMKEKCEINLNLFAQEKNILNSKFPGFCPLDK